VSSTLPDDIILQAQGLSRHFRSGGGLIGGARTVTAVKRIDLEIRRGQIFAIVGESGSGKTTLGRMLAGLLDPTGGAVYYKGSDIRGMSRRTQMDFRRRTQIVFQDPYSALDPRMRIGAQIREPLDIHKIGTPTERRRRVDELLARVGLAPSYGASYPAELSGGQRQRVGIAIALASSPEIIVADEPTSALDVSVQAQVLNLLADLQRENNLTLVFITHDLGIVRHFCDRVAVMYLGQIVEEADTAELFAQPRHPYTRMLFSAIPEPNPDRVATVQLPRGEPPSPLSPPSGCPFHPRCPVALATCGTEVPPLDGAGDRHLTACVRVGSDGSVPADAAVSPREPSPREITMSGALS
jgi:oligopeptide transport system ATP-binding protein